MSVSDQNKINNTKASAKSNLNTIIIIAISVFVIGLIGAVVVLAFSLSYVINSNNNNITPTPTPEALLVKKPVIYLYTTNPQLVNIQLQFKGTLVVTYPKYNNGWNVIAYPDGTLLNLADLKEYSYLFWEGVDKDATYDLTTGFIVKGEDSAEFLQSKLAELGLTPKEYNEFIVYWLPKMLNNQYNLVHFASQAEYADRAVLSVSPKPDSVLRVFMVFKPLEKEISIKPQDIKSFERKGFSVVEWGGKELK